MSKNTGEWDVYKTLMLWRLVWAFLSDTWYVPDETWQSVEVAHGMVFPNGYLTWEWKEGIRSYLHPLFYVPSLAMLKLFQIDNYQGLVILAPKLVQAWFTANCEYRLIDTVHLVYGLNVSWWFSYITMFNWHGIYTGSRTLINTMEYCLTCLTLAFYLPFETSTNHTKKELLKYVEDPYSDLPLLTFMIVVSFMLRPTTALVWLPVVVKIVYQILRFKAYRSLSRAIMTALVTMSVIVYLDSLFYGQLTITPLNFFRVNVFNSIGDNYGTHPWYWYFTHALLPMLTPPLFVALCVGMWKRPAMSGVLFGPIVSTIVSFSLLAHKEMRFLQAAMPFILLLCSIVIVKYRVSRTFLWIFAAVNVVMAGYLSQVHQRGAVDVAVWLGGKVRFGQTGTVWFLTPCHSTPLHSHIHNPYILPRFLTCEPNLSGKANYVDEADQFFNDPRGWLQAESKTKVLPSMIVMFDTLKDELGDFLKSHGYDETRSFFHTHFPEGRVGSRILAYTLPRKTKKI